ncbi:MAG TPA: hypothetical protein DC054_14615 [Blastocatellia bacterium]|nr:hypothetical protein [Blastocatellia bacterium]
MLVTKKMLLALTLVGALVGAGIGALATRTTQSTSAANANYDTTKPVTDTERTPQQIAANNSSQYSTTEEQTAYRQGFDSGYSACTGNTDASRSVAYQSGPNDRSTSRSTRSTRRVYYDYGSSSRGRSFWQKHRDKLTVAMGSGAGALVGGLIGGKKGAGIGLLGGGVGSALYTYKLRKRHRSY